MIMIKTARIFALLTFVVTALFAQVACADEWVASKLRGAVFVFDGTGWQQIYRGHRVDSSRAIQTAQNSRVIFTRGRESIDVRADTRIRIRDRYGKLDTVVEQYFGEITVDVDKRNVQHFAVRAPLLTAVVKGTKFTVRADKSGAAARVDVNRGLVEVRDRERQVKVNVKPGQKAARSKGAREVVEVAGRGKPEPYEDMNTGQVVANNPASLKAKMAKQGKIPSAPQDKLVNATAPVNPNNIQVPKDKKVAKLEQELAAAQAEGADAKEVAKIEEKLEKESSKAEDQRLKAAAKLEKERQKAIEKANKEAAEDAEKAAKEAAKDAEKAAEEKEKAAEKAAEEKEKAAEKAAEEKEKAAEKAAKDKEKAA